MADYGKCETIYGSALYSSQTNETFIIYKMNNLAVAVSESNIPIIEIQLELKS